MTVACKRCGTEGVATQGTHGTVLVNCTKCGTLGFATVIPKKKSKYGNTRVYSVDHGYFDSKMEYKRFGTLTMLEKAGEIRDLKRQVRYKLEHEGVFFGVYIADFVYERDGQTIVEDVKGHRTQAYKTKKRLMKTIHGIDILETSG